MRKIILLCAAFAVLTAADVFAADVGTVTSIRTGAEREQVHAVIGTPDTEAEYKETYSLGGGAIAVLNYSENLFDSGYIVR